MIPRYFEAETEEDMQAFLSSISCERSIIGQVEDWGEGYHFNVLSGEDISVPDSIKEHYPATPMRIWG